MEIGINLNRLYLLLITIVLSNFLTAQQLYTCGNIATPDSNFNQKEFESFKEKYLKNKKEGKSGDSYVIPVRVHIIRTDSGGNGLQNAELVLQETIRKCNLQLDYINLSLELCGINYIDNTTYEKLNIYEVNDLTNTYNDSDILNLYVPSRYWGLLLFLTPLCGSATFPWSNQDYIIVEKDCIATNGVLIHELGHYLGLYHTHETSFGAELVNGSNCTTAGDKLCDTPADPGLFIGGSICHYTGTETDTNGELYDPDFRNFMSYAPRQCVDQFSQEQYLRMAYYLETDRSNLKFDRPDLKAVFIGSEPIKVQNNESFDIDISIQNLNQIDASPIEITWSFLPDRNNLQSKQFLGSSSLASIGGNESELLTITDKISSLNIGLYYILVEIDPDNDVLECFESDNSLLIPVSLIPRIKDTSSNINAFPNPASIMTTIYLQNKSKGTIIARLFTIQGQLINKKVWNKTRREMEIDYDISNLPSGVYILVFQIKEEIQTVKIVKA